MDNFFVKYFSIVVMFFSCAIIFLDDKDDDTTFEGIIKAFLMGILFASGWMIFKYF